MENNLNKGIKCLIFISISIILLNNPLSVFAETDSKIIRVIQAFSDFPDVWEFEDGEIINKANKDQVSPGDPLEYHVKIINPINEDRELSGSLRIFAGGEWKEPIEKWWTIQANSTQNLEIPFTLNDGGSNDVKILFIFDRQISGSLHPNHAFYANGIDVLTEADKILEEVLPWTPIIQGVLAATTIILVVVTFLNMRKTTIFTKEQLEKTDKQLEFTRTELEFRLKADLIVQIGESHLKPVDIQFEGRIILNLINNGVLPARNVRISFKDQTSAIEIGQLIRDEKEIKSNHSPIEGIIKPQSTSMAVAHITKREKSGVYKVAIWVQYDYAEIKNEEFIQIVQVNGQKNTLPALYDKIEIDTERKRQKEIGLNL